MISDLYTKNISMKLYAALFVFLTAAVAAIGQPESESPYSDQTFDPPTPAPWYESPLVWLALLFLVGLIVFMVQRRRRR